MVWLHPFPPSFQPPSARHQADLSPMGCSSAPTSLALCRSLILEHWSRSITFGGPCNNQPADRHSFPWPTWTKDHGTLLPSPRCRLGASSLQCFSQRSHQSLDASSADNIMARLGMYEDDILLLWPTHKPLKTLSPSAPCAQYGLVWPNCLHPCIQHPSPRFPSQDVEIPPKSWPGSRGSTMPRTCHQSVHATERLIPLD